MRSRTSWTLTIIITLGLGTFLSTSTAHAQGAWRWCDPPGCTAGMSSQQRTDLLLNQGIADPNANYFTPDWPGGSRPANEYTGVPDTGFRNTFGVDHDINANSTYLGYFDIFTPLFGTNELEIGTEPGGGDNVNISSLWSSIVDLIMNGWDWLTSFFQDAFTDYNDTGDYEGGSGDSGFYDFFDGGGGDYGGGDYGGGGGEEEELEEEAF